MSLIDNLIWSLRHCRKRLFESLLIVLAIGLGVAVIVAILSLFINIQSQIRYSGNDLYMRTFYVHSSAHFSSNTGMEPPLTIAQERPSEPLELSMADLQSLQEALPDGIYVILDSTFGEHTSLLTLPETESSLPETYQAFDVAGEIVEVYSPWEFYETIQLTATTPNYFQFQELELATGHWFIEEDLETMNQVVVLSDRLASKLFGDLNPIGQILPIESYDGVIEYEVIGVLAPIDPDDFYSIYRDEQGYIPYTASSMMLRNNRFGGSSSAIRSFSIGVSSELDLNNAAEIILSEIEQRFGELAVVNSNYISLQNIDDQQQGMFIMIGILASLGLVIAVINILNLMLARVLKRTKAVGLSIALGASKKNVFTQFLLEAIVLGGVGSFLGIGLSFGIIKLLANVLSTDLGIGLSGVGIGCGIGLLVSLIFGVYPAYLGSQVDPVDALRND